MARITTMDELMKLEPNTDIFTYNNLKIHIWKVIGRMPYKSFDMVGLYRGTEVMVQISKYDLARHPVFIDDKEAQLYLMARLAAEIESIKETYFPEP